MQICKSFNFYFLLKQISFKSCYLIHILAFNTSKAWILNIALCGQETYSGWCVKASISLFYWGCMWTSPHNRNTLPNVQRKRSVTLNLAPFQKHTISIGTGKDITFLDAFDILAAETAKEKVKPGHRAPRHAPLHCTLCRPCLTPWSCFFFEAHSPVQLAVCSSIYFCFYSHLSCSIQ